MIAAHIESLSIVGHYSIGILAIPHGVLGAEEVLALVVHCVSLRCFFIL